MPSTSIYSSFRYEKILIFCSLCWLSVSSSTRSTRICYQIYFFTHNEKNPHFLLCMVVICLLKYPLTRIRYKIYFSSCNEKQILIFTFVSSLSVSSAAPHTYMSSQAYLFLTSRKNEYLSSFRN